MDWARLIFVLMPNISMGVVAGFVVTGAIGPIDNMSCLLHYYVVFDSNDVLFPLLFPFLVKYSCRLRTASTGFNPFLYQRRIGFFNSRFATAELPVSLCEAYSTSPSQALYFVSFCA